MITREELLKSQEFWLVQIQASLFEQVEIYLKENNITKTEFAKKLGVSKGYVSQLLNGDFDHKISKLIELSIAIGKAPVLKFEDIDKYIKKDEKNIQSRGDGIIYTLKNIDSSKKKNNAISKNRLLAKEQKIHYKKSSKKNTSKK
jgi:transcriptional regulator with XRE-family HTH domain